MNINECYIFLNFLSNKVQSGNVKPSDYNIAAQRAQQEFINKEFRVYQKTQEATDALIPLLTNLTMSVPTNGILLYPADYMHMSSVSRIYFNKGVSIPVDVREINNDELSNVMMSQIVQPTLKYPVLSYYDNYIQFYPKNLGSVQLDYLRRPTPPVWGFTVVNNRPVYDPATSIDFIIPDEYQNEIVMMMASYLGIYLRETDLIQYAENMKNEKV
jgi:hypothetical protein